jgi:hypothetical protein
MASFTVHCGCAKALLKPSVCSFEQVEPLEQLNTSIMLLVGSAHPTNLQSMMSLVLYCSQVAQISVVGFAHPIPQKLWESRNRFGDELPQNYFSHAGSPIEEFTNGTVCGRSGRKRIR